MNYQQALDYCHSFERFGCELGLERLSRLLETMGNPHLKTPCIHVGGSNGKGSVCNMTANILARAGYKVGLYTSPFVVDFLERFQINGEMIQPDAFADYATRLKVCVDAVNAEGIHITEFEAITALAFLWFAEQECDMIVLEVGLGGRFDGTNVITKPLLTAITSISLEHVDILGDTIQKIAFEKAGILKQGCVCCVYPHQDVDALAVLLQRCAETDSRLVQINPAAITIQQADQTGNRFCLNGQDYRTALVGEYQIYNATLVVSMMAELRKKGYTIDEQTVQQGIASTAFPARFEKLSDDPYVVIDGAHNLEGTVGLADTLQKIDRRKIVLMGMLADKEYSAAVATIAKQAAIFIAIPVDSPRALHPKQVAQVASEHCDDVRCFDDVTDAVSTALSLLQPDDLLLACGSLYMASAVRTALFAQLD